MQVVLFRHGIAEDREEFARAGRPDSDRPLTGKGAERTRRAAAGLLSVLDGVDCVAASPYVRARQTADIVADRCAEAGRAPERDSLDAMQPGGDYGAVLRWLGARDIRDTVVLVGHEPDLSGLMAWLIAGRRDGFARFKKSGACLIGFAAPPARGDGELLAFLPPAVLRQLAGN
ncbi:MAG: phosphohistidine phosphatase SixA [Gammaproteobacteria bacterium]|nr:phosphohistidine phosphatase SixA [Gammaproteobacteria bacterium]